MIPIINLNNSMHQVPIQFVEPDVIELNNILLFMINFNEGNIIDMVVNNIYFLKIIEDGIGLSDIEINWGILLLGCIIIYYLIETFINI